MIKKSAHLIMMLLPVLCIGQEVVSSSGDEFSTSNTILSYTIGEIAVESTYSFLKQTLHIEKEVENKGYYLHFEEYKSPTSKVFSLYRRSENELDS